jgi:hypothetical protein
LLLLLALVALSPGLLMVVVLLDSVLSEVGAFLVLVMLLVVVVAIRSFGWVGCNVGLFVF